MAASVDIRDPEIAQLILANALRPRRSSARPRGGCASPEPAAGAPEVAAAGQAGRGRL